MENEIRNIQKATSINARELKEMYQAIDKLKANTGDRYYSESAFIRDSIAEKVKRVMGGK